MKSTFKMLKNFAKEVKQFAEAGAPHVTTLQYKKRVDACAECPHLKKDIDRCGLCGCLIEHKAKWATAKCPDDPARWEPVKVGEGGKKIKLKKNDNKGDNPEAGDEVQPSTEQS